MRTCKTCRWWGSWLAAPNYGECNSEYVEARSSPNLDDMPRDSGLLARDEESDALILVHADFGCIHWEAKP